MEIAIRMSSGRRELSIIEAMDDPNLFLPWFQDKKSWARWRSFLKVLFHLKMDREDIRTYRQFTKRNKLPKAPFNESWLVIGRRGGKSRILALIAVYLACFKDWKKYLSPGERGMLVIIATDRRQARVIFRYIQAFFEEIPLLKGVVLNETMERFDLRGQISIEIHTATYRGVRGYTIIAALLDEIAFWRTDKAQNPDYEILAALRPGMATMPGSMMLCASSPYARTGELYNNYKKHFGEDDSPVLIWQAKSLDMNPTLDPRVVEEAYERDPYAARSEYDAEFRTDVENFIPIEVLEDCTDKGSREKPYSPSFSYNAFVDVSGGSQDSFTLAISHKEGDRVVLDVIRERMPPFSPDDVVAEYSELMKKYSVYKVTGDRYGGEWPRERFERHGIYYEVSKRFKSQLYSEFLPLINTGKVVLLDNDKMIRQFASLIRRKTSSGRETIDHPPKGQDDLANVVAGSVVESGTVTSVDLW